MSTPELIHAIARAAQGTQQDGVGKMSSGSAIRHTSRLTRHSPRLFPFPEKVLRAMGRLAGLGALRKLTTSLYVDSEPVRCDLGWSPPCTLEEGLQQTITNIKR